MSHTPDEAPELRLDAAFYDLLMEAAGAIYAALAAARKRDPSTTAPPPILQLRSGLAESPGWFLLQAAEFDPEPLTVAGLRVRDIYASERIVAALLDLMASEGWFDQSPAGVYALADAGRSILNSILERRQRLLRDIALLPKDAEQRLSTLLARVVEASQAAANPPGTWCLAHSRRRAPPADAPVLTRLLQLFEDLNAFRDDAHMAAWQPLKIEGYVWEAFAFVCAEEARTAGDLFGALMHRGYTQGEYLSALDGLVARGWLVRSAQNTYTVTPEGRGVRRRVEEQTDSAFYAPWSVLDTNELLELQRLVMDLAALA